MMLATWEQDTESLEYKIIQHLTKSLPHFEYSDNSSSLLKLTTHFAKSTELW